MPALSPPVCNFGWHAPKFDLLATNNQRYQLENACGPNGLLVMFICNHCPFVKAIVDRLVEDCRLLQEQGIGVIAIMSNDTETYPADSWENMVLFAKEHRFTFPYAIDTDQSVARAYNAVCTPDFFGFNQQLELQYRGRFDNSGRNPPHAQTRHDLYEAMQQVAHTGIGPSQQIASIGCSIKWKE